METSVSGGAVPTACLAPWACATCPCALGRPWASPRPRWCISTTSPATHGMARDRRDLVSSLEPQSDASLNTHGSSIQRDASLNTQGGGAEREGRHKAVGADVCYVSNGRNSHICYVSLRCVATDIVWMGGVMVASFTLHRPTVPTTYPCPSEARPATPPTYLPTYLPGAASRPPTYLPTTRVTCD